MKTGRYVHLYYALVGALIVPLFGRLALSGTGHETEYFRYLVPLFVGTCGGLVIGLLQKRAVVRALELNHLKAERNGATYSLDQQKKYLNAILDNTNLAIYLKDINFKYLVVNRQYELLSHHQRENILGKEDCELFPESVASLFREQDQEVIKNSKPMDFEETIPLPDGTMSFITSKFPLFDEKGNIYAVGGVCTDITEKKKMEGELLKIKKLESVGILAGGIAHDFNNILSGILGNVSLAKLQAKSNEMKEFLSELERAALRARGLTQQLLTFSKGGEPIRKLASVDEIISDSAEFVLRGSNVSFGHEISPDLWAVEVDPGQISQVIQNIIMNANQAMPEGGTIQIHSENFMNEGTLPLEHDRFVKVMITDSGEGIEKEILDRIFDPYFTTKERGSGLGLAITHSIITKHKGHITVHSKEGKGTTFTLYLPATDKTFKAELAESVKKLDGGKRVLVMDDEDIVRAICEKMLSHLSFDVVLAKNGAEALKLYKDSLKSPKPIDVVIMDLTIPGGMGGKEAVKELLKLDPDAKVIVTSGYSNDPVLSNYKKFGFSAALEKPFEIDHLVDVISKVLQ